MFHFFYRTEGVGSDFIRLLIWLLHDKTQVFSLIYNSFNGSFVQWLTFSLLQVLTSNVYFFSLDSCDASITLKPCLRSVFWWFICANSLTLCARQKYGWQELQESDLQFGKLAINVQVIFLSLVCVLKEIMWY